ncbi:MAG: hypothetical protein ACLQGJ_12055 [Candidatus Dormibacteria bacterium]
MTDHAEPGDTASGPQDVPEGATLLLLDDNLALLESLKEAVEADDTITVVGMACRIRDGLRLAAATQPQVAVIDINMPMVAVGRPHAVCDRSVQIFGSLHTRRLVKHS